jgi:hypothetical protein
MKRILVLSFVCLVLVLALSGCKDSTPTAPTPPTTLPDIVLKVDVNFGVASTYGATLTWDVYTGTTKMGTLSFTGGSGDGLNQKTVTVSYNRPSSFTEEDVVIKFVLMTCSQGASWADGANHQYWVQATPVSSNVSVDPTTQQRVGPFKGWTIGEGKTLTFKMKKI